MAFIEKKDPVVLNIKLTTKGRELLSTGNLTFKYFAIGDSEIDYEFNAETGLIPFDSKILRPADNNPNIISFIPKSISGDPYNSIPTIPSSWYPVTNSVESIGFFTSGCTSFITDSNHVKQPDVMILMTDVVSGNTIPLRKAPLYGRSAEEPAVGDLILIKWTVNINTTGDTLNKTNPTPYLIYRINAKTGTLAADTLIVTVDRNLPDFTGIAGAGIYAGALIYYNFINYSGSTIFNDFSTDYIDESVLSFFQNSQCPTIVFPFWNMSIIFTEEIAGVQAALLGDKTFGQFDSKAYGGFVSYIQSQQPFYKKLGVIHYTNSSSANVYGEGFYLTTPLLEIPTIMWHKNNTATLGAKFRSGNGFTLTNLGIHYYDLVDVNDPTIIVGKIFDELKMFLIEDQELLFAMSYKSNRSWTLPEFMMGGGGGDCPPIPPAPQTLFVQTIIGTPGSIKNTGGINIVGYQNITEFGVEYKLTGDTVWKRITGGTSLATNSFSIDINDTLPDKSYNYRSYVKIGKNEYVDIYSNFVIKTLPTPPAPPPPPPIIIPSVLTTPGTGAIGQINNTGGNSIPANVFVAIEKYWMEYRISGDTNWTKTTELSGPLSVNNFTFNITGLINTVTTTYEYRAVIQVAGVAYPSGTIQSTPVQAQTAPTIYIPEATTGYVFKQLSTNEQLIDVLIKNNYVTSDGGATITRYGILYTQFPAYYDAANLTYGNVGAEVKMAYLDGVPASFTLPFIMSITGLFDSSPFYYRTFALNSVGVGYGEVKNGTTIPLVVVPPAGRTIYICGATTPTNPLVTSAISAKIGVSSPLGSGESIILHLTDCALSDTVTDGNEMLIANIRAEAYYTLGGSTVKNNLANSTISLGTQENSNCQAYNTLTVTASNIDSICLHANAYSASKNGGYTYTNCASVNITEIENVGGANYVLATSSLQAYNTNSGTGGSGGGGGGSLPPALL